MQQRLMTYDVFAWADDFLTTLDAVKKKQQRLSAKILNQTTREKIINHFQQAELRTLFLDYDGTLVPYADHPAKAQPGKELLSMLDNLSRLKSIHVIIVSGRDKRSLERWFGHLPVSMVAEHGIFIKERGEKW